MPCLHYHCFYAFLALWYQLKSHKFHFSVVGCFCKLIFCSYYCRLQILGVICIKISQEERHFSDVMTERHVYFFSSSSSVFAFKRAFFALCHSYMSFWLNTSRFQLGIFLGPGSPLHCDPFLLGWNTSGHHRKVEELLGWLWFTSLFFFICNKRITEKVFSD